MYYTSPEIPDWFWTTSSVVMAVTGLIGITTNGAVIFAYQRTNSVRENIYLGVINILEELRIAIAINSFSETFQDPFSHKY